MLALGIGVVVGLILRPLVDKLIVKIKAKF